MDFRHCSDISPNVTEAGVNPAALAAWDNILSKQFERAALGPPESDPCHERREEVARSLPKAKPSIGPR
jgi:hypothetical protein